MTSIQREISGTIIANQVRLERATHDGSFLLVEGSEDAKLFGKFCNSQQCSIIVCIGREKLLEAITILERSNFVGALAIADRNYSEFFGHPEFEGEVIFSDENDIEIMILCSPALDNVLREFGAEDKVSAVVEAEGRSVCELIFDAASFLGALRLSSQTHGLSLSFEGMKYKFADQNSFSLDKVQTLRHVLARSKEPPQMTEEEILTNVKKQLSRMGQGMRVCKGHDCLRVLGRALRKKLGTTNQFSSEEGSKVLGGILRLAYEFEFFQQTRIYHSVRKWENETGFKVLH